MLYHVTAFGSAAVGSAVGLHDAAAPDSRHITIASVPARMHTIHITHKLTKISNQTNKNKLTNYLIKCSDETSQK